MTVVQERTAALPRETMEDFLSAPPPWEVLCLACGANADPEAKVKKTPTKKGKGSKKAAAAAAAAAAAGEGEEEVWPALRCAVCHRPRHVECLLLAGQSRVSVQVWCFFSFGLGGSGVGGGDFIFSLFFLVLQVFLQPFFFV